MELVNYSVSTINELHAKIICHWASYLKVEIKIHLLKP
jgi:hypothetical protein